MFWAAAIPAIASVAGGVLGKMMEGDRNIDKSPGMQQTTKDMLTAAYPGVISSLYRQRPRIERVGVSPVFERGLGQVEQAAGEMAPQIETAQQAWGQGLQVPDVANNPYMQGILSSIAQRGGREFLENINPTLRRESIAGGMYGGGRSGINQGLAAGRVADAVTDAQRSALMQGYGQGLAHQRGLLGMSPQMAGLGMLPGQTLMQAGGTEQDARTAAMQAEFARRGGFEDLRYGPMERWIGSHASMWGSGTPTQYPKPSGAAQGAGIGMIAGRALQGLFGQQNPNQEAINTAGSAMFGQ